MSALDSMHRAVRNALVKDGWTVTHDPFRLPVGKRNMYIDLGAERLIAADKGTRRIAVEVKTFSGRSEIADLEQAVGQYIIYNSLLKRKEPERMLYIAVPDEIVNTLFQEIVGEIILEDSIHHLFSFDPNTEEIVRWIPET